MTGLPMYRHGGRDRDNYGPDRDLRRKRRGLVFAVVFGVASFVGLGLLFFWNWWGG